MKTWKVNVGGADEEEKNLALGEDDAKLAGAKNAEDSSTIKDQETRDGVGAKTPIVGVASKPKSSGESSGASTVAMKI